MFPLNYATIIDPLLRDVRLYTVAFAGMKAGDRVLDVCCGTGDQVFHYAGEGITPVGIDLDAHMLELARRDKRNRVFRNASFQIADAQNLPFKDGLFDYASISLALHEKKQETRNRVISEMKRVVKREGALIFIDYSVPLPENLLSGFVRIVEFIAGRTHYRCFKDYLARGGLDVLLRENHLFEEKRTYLKNGLIAMVKTENQGALSTSSP